MADLADNYIYLYNTDTYLILPGYSDNIQDSININYQSSTPLARSAPIYSFQHSGPRSVSFSFTLHRDMMTQLNTGVSNVDLKGLSNTPITSANGNNQDYVDYLIRALQTMALPEYASSEKMVNPPIVAIRMGKDIFIKGVIQNNVSLTYKLPILSNGKYSTVEVSFSVAEIDPYDASTVMKQGSYRGISTTLERRIYQLSNGISSNTAQYPVDGQTMFI